MEISNTDDSKKDEKMKKTFESSSDDSDKKESTKRPLKKSIFLPVEKESQSTEKDQDKPLDLKSIFEKILKPDEDNESEEVVEKEASVESLDQEDTAKVAEAYVEQNLDDAQQELESTQPETSQHAEAAASVAFIKALGETAKQQTEIDEKTLDEIAEQVVGDIEVESDYKEEENTEADQQLEEASESVKDDESGIEKDDQPAVATTLVPPKPPMPPVPPAPPYQSGGIQPPGQPQIPVPNRIQTPNMSEIDDDTEFQIKRRRAGDLLLGGIIGYMIGRRRGRINTENKLLPIQEKLEKKVTDLQDAIASKELAVRKAAAIQFEKQHVIVEKQPEKTEKQINSEEKVEAKNGTLVIEHKELQPDSKEEILSRPEKNINKKTVETMSLPFLLEIAEGISLGGTSLRSLYERGVVDQKQLRKVVEQYFDGQSIEKIWPKIQEVVGVEDKIERSYEHQADPLPGVQYVDPSANHSVATNFANPHFYNQSLESRTIINEEKFSEKFGPEPKTKKISPTIAIILAVFVAIVIIVMFT